MREREVDYLLIDCSYPPGVESKGHNTLDEALDLVSKVQAKAFYLTHIDHSLDSYLIKNPEQLTHGVQLARDGMCFELI